MSHFPRGRGNGVLRYQGRLRVPNINGLRNWIHEESYASSYSIHPGYTNMYDDLREVFLWGRMKKDIAKFDRKTPNR